MSEATKLFLRNIKDIEMLFVIHQQITGTRTGRRVGVETLNKSAIVLITAIWEAFCEDILAEATEVICGNISNTNSLPEAIKKGIATKIKNDKHELACWRLAEAGWKNVLRDEYVSSIISGMNSPTSFNVRSLFDRGIGLDDVTINWSWPGMSVESACRKLDSFVDIRHKIAHRGKLPKSSVSKGQAESYLYHVARLVRNTKLAIDNHTMPICGKTLNR